MATVAIAFDDILYTKSLCDEVSDNLSKINILVNFLLRNFLAIYFINQFFVMMFTLYKDAVSLEVEIYRINGADYGDIWGK